METVKSWNLERRHWLETFKRGLYWWVSKKEIDMWGETIRLVRSRTLSRLELALLMNSCTKTHWVQKDQKGCQIIIWSPRSGHQKPSAADAHLSKMWWAYTDTHTHVHALTHTKYFCSSSCFSFHHPVTRSVPGRREKEEIPILRILSFSQDSDALGGDTLRLFLWCSPRFTRASSFLLLSKWVRFVWKAGRKDDGMMKMRVVKMWK